MMKKFISILLLTFIAFTAITSCTQEPNTRKIQEIDNRDVQQQKTNSYTSYVCKGVEHYQNGRFSLGEDVRSTLKIKNGTIYVDLRKSVCATEMQFRINSEEVDGNIIKYYTTGNYSEKHTFYIDHKENTIRMENYHKGTNYTIILNINRKS